MIGDDVRHAPDGRFCDRLIDHSVTFGPRVPSDERAAALRSFEDLDTLR